jgi:hypothetical protein
VDSLVQIFTFLGVSKMSHSAIEKRTDLEVIHNIGYKAMNFAKPNPMLKSTRIMLDEFYRESNLKLAELMNDTRFTYA